ncbi:hypothetical protein ANO14919_122170 [Xylariales sp. No.14919]|nr:hypothetical protein ANO14919_122170 [Xylariales sp. No.14919]
MALATWTWKHRRQTAAHQIVGYSPRLLEACDFLRKDRLEAQTGRPIHPTIAAQLDEIVVASLVEAELAGLSNEDVP